eukprot:jgi/Chrzof1/9981/Cz04g22220.t1
MVDMTCTTIHTLVITPCVFVTVLQSLACTKISPLTRNWIGTPTAGIGVKLLALKVLLILCSSVLTSFAGAQSVLMLLAAAGVLYYQLTAMPYYWDWLNHIWTGLWGGLTVTISVLVALSFSDQNSDPIWRANINKVRTDGLHEQRLIPVVAG